MLRKYSNGACSTRQCKLLLEALQWAVSPEQGNVKVLALIVCPRFRLEMLIADSVSSGRDILLQRYCTEHYRGLLFAILASTRDVGQHLRDRRYRRVPPF